MNTTTLNLAIISSLLALFGAVYLYTVEPTKDQPRIALNHNETLLNDAVPSRKIELLPTRLARPELDHLDQISWRDCGALRCDADKADSKEIGAAQDVKASPQDSWLHSILDFFFRGTQQLPGGDCDDFGCGTNHNETLVKDGVPLMTDTKPVQVDTWNRDWQPGAEENTGPIEFETAQEIKVNPEDSWLKSIWDFFFRGTEQPPGSDCDEFGCGGNHNETLLKDVIPVETNQIRWIDAPGIPGVHLNADWLAGNMGKADSTTIETVHEIKALPQNTWLKSVWDFFFRETQQPPGSDCDEFGCGMNHHEALVNERYVNGGIKK